MPKVSIVIPNYNYGRFLEQRLRSVFSQTFQDFEVVYLDDASTDDSREVISKFTGDPRIRIVENRHNSGNVFAQWNRGVRECSGEYVWIAEADDFADPGFLAAMVECLDRNPAAGLAWCQSWQVDERGATVDLTQSRFEWLSRDRWSRDYTRNGIDEVRECLAYMNTIPNASAVVFRRTLYERVSRGNEGFQLCGDWYTWVQIALASQVTFVSRPLNYYRSHPNTVRAAARRDCVDIEEMGRVTMHVVREVGLPGLAWHRLAARVFRLGFRYLVGWTTARLSSLRPRRDAHEPRHR